jgi:hypothetical protein
VEVDESLVFIETVAVHDVKDGVFELVQVAMQERLFVLIVKDGDRATLGMEQSDSLFVLPVFG